MNLARPAVAALALVSILVMPVQAQDSLHSRVVSGHADMGASLIHTPAKVGYLDADLDGTIDAATPDEPVYFDLDGNGRVTYGDMRLTPFGAYPAGTLVNLTNRDYGLILATPQGWFAFRDGNLAAFDADFSGTLSLGDVRLDGTKPRAGDPDMGQTLVLAQTASPSQRVGYLDRNNDRLRQFDEPIYLDMDTHLASGMGKVSEGDIAIRLGMFGEENHVTRAEFDALKTTPAGQPGGIAAPTGPGMFQYLLVALALLNLGGLVYVVREVNRMKPRNPYT